jgi:probable phosphoglycerate mutase
MVEPVGEGEIREEFEAVWAVVRRLEAHIRRLEATVSELRTELDRSRATPSNEPAAEPAPAPPVATSPDEPVAAFDQDGGDGAPRYTLVFDGGSIGNPGRGYGSFQVTNARGATIADRFDFSPAGESITNNQAEYLTLIGSLERLRDVLGERAVRATVDIRGDSQLVINQLLGRWKVQNAELKPLHQRARELLSAFGRTELRWHDRANSVRTLGH